MDFGWGIISTGLHPENKIAPAINNTPGAQLVSVYSRDKEQGQSFAEKHGALAAYDSLDELLQDNRVDGVFLCSPNSMHAQHGIRAANSGKHVLSEKPMTTTLADAIAMVKACRDNGVTLGTGYHLRTHPAHVLAKETIQSGALGNISLIQGQWGFGARGDNSPPTRTGRREWWEQPDLIGGAASLMGTGVHVVDILRFILDEEITEIATLTDGQTETTPLERTATTIIRFTSGALATVCCGRLLPDSKNDLAIYGTTGRILGRATLWEARQGRIEIISNTTNQTKVFPSNYLANFIAEISDFQESVEMGRDPVSSGINGLRVVEATLAMIESAKTGRTIKLNPVTL